MSHGRAESELSSLSSHTESCSRSEASAQVPGTDDQVEWAIAELMDVLAERADDPHAQAALQTLRDAFSVVRTRASTDPLTGLMNRASFDRVLPEALARARENHSELALLFMDLDGFKSVNDKNGHPTGDSLLKEVARRATSSVREDDLLARYGGDEFVVLLELLSDRGVVDDIATRIIDTLSAPIVLADMQVQLSVSIGVALFPDHARDAGELVLHADAAMYWAKHEGGNRYMVWREESDDRSGSYARFESNQRSTSAANVPVRRA
jgi:diguanylate cyclase (GGDEF)-like protein